MKDLLKKIQTRDKVITAACRTTEGLEWTTLKVTQDGDEPAVQGSLPVEIPDEITEESLSALLVPEELTEVLEGDISVALRTSELLMRTMEFPTSDPAEIADMVGFQVDKISPFPLDQLAISHEILGYTDDSATVLMAAAKRESIDAIGDIFERSGVNIHSIDARSMGWLQLLRDEKHLSESGTEVLILVDGIDFVLAVLLEGKPLVFRSLHARLDDMEVVDELTREIAYTLTTLDSEYTFPMPTTIDFWSIGDVPMPLRSKLAEKCGLLVLYHDLATLPSLSDGLLRRACSKESRIELIPTEWIELQKRKKLIRKFSIISGGIAAVWISVLLIFFTVYKVRDIKLARIKEQAKVIAPAAEAAQNNQNKLKALKVYTDRSDSSLECLREVTRLLPAGDIEFNSYKYNKGKSVALRGNARSDDLATDFLESLNKSSLFEGTKDERTENKTTKGVRRTIFSVTLVLKSEEEGK
jgi:hypothetical protein